MRKERILISMEAQERVTDVVNKVANRLGVLQKTYKGVDNVARKLGISTEEAKKNFLSQGLLFEKGGIKMATTSALVSKGANLVNSTFSGMKGIFKGASWVIGKVIGLYRGLNSIMRKTLMGTLSLLFASMALNRIFKGLVQPILDVFGVTDLFHAILIDLLLPAFLPLFDYLLEFMEWMMNLPTETKKFIGMFIIGATILTTFGLVLSQIMLLFSGFGLFLGSAMAILGPFAAVLASVTAAVFILGDDAEITVDKLNNFLKNGIEKVVEWIDKLAEKFHENLPLIKKLGGEIIDTLLEGMIDLLEALDPFVEDFLKTLGEFYESKKSKIDEIVWKIMDWFMQALLLVLPIATEMGFTILNAILDAILNQKENVKETMEKVLDIIKLGLEEAMPKLIEVGKIIASGILEGILSFAMDNIGSIVIAISGAIIGGVVGSLVGGPIGTVIGAGIGGTIGGAVGAIGIGSYGSTASVLKHTTSTGTTVLPMIHLAKGTDYVPSTGPYVLHKGEAVIPANQNRPGMNITINATVANDYDVRRLADQLKRYWTNDFEKLTQARGVS